ncbi:DUF6053 domain-containing protein [Lysobacter enzymogenes]|uniref:DUF6053 domain-containing protein n=1 Tax=Lysobacter enzymogenes TaxID=69 RepID=UPI003D18DBD5
MRTTGLLWKAVVGGPSGPTPYAQVAVIGHKGIGAEAPPIKAEPPRFVRRFGRDLQGEKRLSWEDPSGPTPCAQVAVIGHKGIGAEAPPTKAAPIKADRRDKRGDWAAGAGRAEPSRPAS